MSAAKADAAKADAAKAAAAKADAADAVIRVSELAKTYRAPLSRRRVDAVRGISFHIRKGEVFGFLGPNGAGKTTTIRILMGLIQASGGSAAIFGDPVPSRAARARLGFLPEAPYFYDYLTVSELLDLSGRLFGVDRRTRRTRADALIERVGLTDSRNTPLKKYSKGMLQRAGIAQALIHDPELVVFDEPMSGLDPMGRKDVRDIIYDLRDRGRTVFFSSHILADVEDMCDRVAIIVRGVIRDFGAVTELLAEGERGTEVTLRLPPDLPDEASAADALAAHFGEHTREGRRINGTVRLPPGAADPGAPATLDALIDAARAIGASVEAIVPRRESLEDLFIRHVAAARKPDSVAAAEPAAPAAADREEPS